MSNVDSDKGYSFGQILLAVFAGVVGIALVLVIWAKIFGVTEQVDVAEPTAQLAQIEENIKPVAAVEVAEAGAAGAAFGASAGFVGSAGLTTSAGFATGLAASTFGAGFAASTLGAAATTADGAFPLP